jgi:hypothetical protein
LHIPPYSCIRGNKTEYIVVHGSKNLMEKFLITLLFLQKGHPVDVCSSKGNKSLNRLETIPKTVLLIKSSAMSRILVVIAHLFLGICAIKAQDLTDGLLVHYPMNSTAVDISGNGFNGTQNGVSSTIDHLGFEDAALEFNGTNSFINLPENDALEPPLPITIAFRVKFDDLQAASSQILGTDFFENTYTGIWFGLNPNTYQMQVSYGDGTIGCTSSSCRRTKQGTTVIQTGIWYRVVGIVRGPQDMDIYINCRNDEGQYTGTGGGIEYSNEPGSIGRVDQSTLEPYYFDGALDDFRYWDRELTEDEVLMLCSPTLDILSPDPLLQSTIDIHFNSDSQEIYWSNVLTNESLTYQVYSVTGQPVLAGSLEVGNYRTVDVSALSEGVYILWVTSSDKSFVGEFVKTN